MRGSLSERLIEHLFDFGESHRMLASRCYFSILVAIPSGVL